MSTEQGYPDAAPSSGKQKATKRSSAKITHGTTSQDSNDGKNDSSSAIKRRKQSNSKNLPATIQQCIQALEALEDVRAVGVALDKISDEIEASLDFTCTFVGVHQGITNTSKAMKKYTQDSCIQIDCLYALDEILGQLPQFSSTMVGLNVLDLAGKAMRRFPTVCSVHMNSFHLFYSMWKSSSLPQDRSKLLECLKSLLPCLGHALIADWNKNESNFEEEDKTTTCQICAKLLWRASKTLEGRKMILDTSVPLQLNKLIIQTPIGKLKDEFILLQFRIMQDHYGNLKELSSKNIVTMSCPDFDSEANNE